MVQKTTIVGQSAGSRDRGSIRVQLTRQADKSLTDIIDQISAALRAKFKIEGTENSYRFWYPREVFDDYLIAREDDTNKLFKIDYTIEGDSVTFAEPIEVEEEYVEVADGNGETEVMQVLRLRQSADAEGWKWRFQVVAFGLSKTRHHWKKEVFEQSLRKYGWENLPCFVDHPTETEMRELPERSIKSKAGWWSNFVITEEGLDATLTIKPSAEWLRADIKAAYEAGNLDFYGASILVAIQARQVNWTDGRPATEPTEVRPISIDLVTDAAAGGKVKYALASDRGRNNPQGETAMLKEFLAALFLTNKVQFELVRQSLAGAGAQGVTAETNEDQLAGVVAGSEELSRQAITLFRQPAASDPPQTQPSNGDGPIAFARMPQEIRDGYISQALRDSQLPEATIQSIRRRLGTTATLEDVTREIDSARDILATISQSGNVINPRAEVIAERADKLSIGLAKAFGLTREQYNGAESRYERFIRQSGSGIFRPDDALFNSVPAIRSIRQLYLDLTGDVELSGRHPMTQRITKQATWITSDFTELLASVMHKRLLRDYRSLTPTWRKIALVKAVSDFKTQEAILMGYFTDLPDVAQQGDYLEPSALTDTQETYSISKRGRVVSLSWETVVNDDLGGFMRVYGRQGRAAARTLLKYVWNTCFMANPTLNADSKALFHVDHANLITDALGTAGLKNAVTAMLNQTEPGSSEKMDVDTMSLTLAVPPGIYLDAQSLTDFNNSPGGELDALAQLVRRMGIMPVAVPFFSDANDWALIAPVEDGETVEIGFLNGNEEPELFTQSDQTQGDAFGKDTVAKYKIRHVYGGTPVDHRRAVKSVVAG